MTQPTTTHLCENCTHYMRQQPSGCQRPSGCQQREGHITGRCRLTRRQVPRTQTGCYFWETNNPDPAPDPAPDPNDTIVSEKKPDPAHTPANF